MTLTVRGWVFDEFNALYVQRVTSYPNRRSLHDWESISIFQLVWYAIICALKTNIGAFT